MTLKEKCFTYIRNMYKGIKSMIKINDMSTIFFTYNVGVRQGENLSPLILKFFLQEKGIVDLDLQSVTESIEVELKMSMKLLILLYADVRSFTSCIFFFKKRYKSTSKVLLMYTFTHFEKNVLVQNLTHFEIFFESA